MLKKYYIFDIFKTCYHLYQNNPTCSARIWKRHENLSHKFSFFRFLPPKKLNFRPKWLLATYYTSHVIDLSITCQIFDSFQHFLFDKTYCSTRCRKLELNLSSFTFSIYDYVKRNLILHWDCELTKYFFHSSSPVKKDRESTFLLNTFQCTKQLLINFLLDYHHHSSRVYFYFSEPRPNVTVMMDMVAKIVHKKT